MKIDRTMTAAKTYPLLAQVRVASPCSADWDEMTGDDRVRFCGACRKNVYNLSELTAPQAETLIREQEGNFCGRYFVRPDGGVLTADCPVGLAAIRGRLRRAAFGALALAATLVVGTLQLLGATRFMTGTERIGALHRLRDKLTLSGRGLGKVTGMTAVAGGICIPAPPTPAVAIVEEPIEETLPPPK